MNHYHVTVPVSGQLRLDYDQKAKSQDQRILDFINANRGRKFSHADIESQIGFAILPTSCRRSLSNLHAAGKIRRCGDTLGGHGRRVYLYQAV